jgi:hypothetical protein
MDNGMNDDDRLITDISDEEMLKMYEEAQNSLDSEELYDDDPDFIKRPEEGTAVDEYGCLLNRNRSTTAVRFSMKKKRKCCGSSRAACITPPPVTIAILPIISCSAQSWKRISKGSSLPAALRRTVLEKEGTELQHLNNLSIEELYCMVSLHFRKCGAAYMDIQEAGGGQDLNVIRLGFPLGGTCRSSACDAGENRTDSRRKDQC